MYYCDKCKKEVSSKKELYRGLCYDCYYDYLLEKIEHIGDPEYSIKKEENIITKLIKKILKK